MNAPVPEPVPTADAVCAVCGHDGAAHHDADIACGELHDGGTACWAHMPPEQRSNGTAGPVGLCDCRRFVPEVDGIDRLTAPVQVFQEPEPALCASVRDVLPCVLAEDHGGDVHRDVNGYEWPTAPSLKGRALLDALTVERAEAAHRRRLGLDLPEQTTTTPTGDPR